MTTQTLSKRTKKLSKKLAKREFASPREDLHFLIDFHALMQNDRLAKNDVTALFRGDQDLVKSLMDDYKIDDFDLDKTPQGFWRGFGKLVGMMCTAAALGAAAAFGKGLVPKKGGN